MTNASWQGFLHDAVIGNWGRTRGPHVTVIALLELELTSQACAIGRASKTVREFLEKHYTENLERDETIKLTIKALLEVVQTGAKNIEISVMESYGVVRVSSC